MSKIYVLMKHTQIPHPTIDVEPGTPMGAYATEAGLELKLERIAKANPQYPLEQIANNVYRIGPEDYEGFFGDRVIYLYVHEVELFS